MFTKIGGGEEAHISTKIGQDLLRRRRNAMKKTSKMSKALNVFPQDIRFQILMV